MITTLPATFVQRHGVDPGPRVRPRRDRWRLDGASVQAERARGHVVVGVVGSTGPRVLVTMDQDAEGPYVTAAYVQAVLGAGGSALLAPPGELRDELLLAGADALVLTGGAFDIHPRHYGEDRAGRLDRVDEERTVMELALARRALRGDVPVLGICGGMQAMVVAGGGTLIQDLPADPTHEQPTDPAEPWHDVACEGAMAGWLGERLRVNSTHHQAAAELGPGFQAQGWSPDGVVEAVQVSGHAFAVGVQWHPELMGDLRLYEALVGAARAQTSEDVRLA